MDLSIKRSYTVVDTAFPSGEASPDAALRKVAIVVIVDNPYAGRHVEDLQPLVDISPTIGRTMGEMLVQALHPYKAQSYGKAGIVWLNGEQEHAEALAATRTDSLQSTFTRNLAMHLNHRLFKGFALLRTLVAACSLAVAAVAVAQPADVHVMKVGTATQYFPIQV